MKKILAALLLTAGAISFAPEAQAGGYGYHDHYEYRDRPTYRSTTRVYRAPVVVHRSVRVRHYEPYCAPRPVYYAPRPVHYAPRVYHTPVYHSSRPRLSFHIGF